MISLVLTVLCAAPTSSQPEGTATLPLSELIPLISHSEPLAAPGELLVSRLKLSAHPGESGLWLEGEITVRLIGGSAGRTPILKVGPDTLFEELPGNDLAALSVVNGQLTASSRSAAAETLAFKVLLRAHGEATRSVSLQMAPGMPPSPVRLDVDDNLFQLSGATVVREWGGYVVFPVSGTYAFAWTDRTPAAKVEVARRAPVEPMVTEATGQWVSTLEGRATHTVKLALQVDRPSELTVSVPEGQVLLGARVNSQPVTLAGDLREVKLKVQPNVLGGTDATVELSLLKDLGVFHLSGQFALEAPRLSWPVKRWHSEAVLPAVFNYLREGGSMEQVGSPAIETSEVPGRTLVFTQHLVQASAPTVALRYSVDISKSYFR